jgi:hypothetical protein
MYVRTPPDSSTSFAFRHVTERHSFELHSATRLREDDHLREGSISVSPFCGSSRFCIAIGSTVTITSSVGDT